LRANGGSDPTKFRPPGWDSANDNSIARWRSASRSSLVRGVRPGTAGGGLKRGRQHTFSTDAVA
jgi:hypothetical protein